MIFALIFGILGLYFGGLGGMFAGFLIGSVFDNIRNRNKARRAQEEFTKSRQQYYNDPAQFEEQLLTLLAYVAKADDNRLLQSEFEYCKRYFQKNFPHSDLSQLMLRFRDILNDSDTDSACQDACGKIRQYATVHEKIAVLQCLFEFATADGNAHQKEQTAIRQIAGWCGVDSLTFEAVRLMYTATSYSGGDPFGGAGGYGGGYSGSYGGGYYDSSSSQRTVSSGPSLDDCYRILEVSPDASDEEVKKAYRKAAIKHHPDKVSHLGEDARKRAEETFAKVNQAYDKIKAARGIK